MGTRQASPGLNEVKSGAIGERERLPRISLRFIRATTAPRPQALPAERARKYQKAA